MRPPILILMLFSISLARCNSSESNLKTQALKETELKIFEDDAEQGLVRMKWPLQSELIVQKLTSSSGHGDVWDIQGQKSQQGVAHIQFMDGVKDLSRFQNGYLEFDLNVLVAQPEQKILVKLDGGYPKTAVTQIELSTMEAEQFEPDSMSGPSVEDCRQREPAIVNAEKFGELDTLRKSSDPSMPQCVDRWLASQKGTGRPGESAPEKSNPSWRHLRLPLASFAKNEGFDFASVQDPIVIQVPGGNAFHIQLDNIRLVAMVSAEQGNPEPTSPTPPPSIDGDSIGDRSTMGSIVDGVSVTQGTIRVRRRHENDLDFSKYNPFYWDGRLVQFKIEDFTPKNQHRLRFTLETERPNTVGRVGHYPVASWIYIGDPNGADETLRSKFYQDVDLKPIGNSKTVFQYDWQANMNDPKIAAAMQPGAVMVVEFRVFLDKDDPFFVDQKQKNPHTLFNYYSEFFRIKIGSPGLYIDDLTNKDTVADPARYTGGWTTTPTVRVEPWRGLQQQATNILPENSMEFLMGRTWFHTDFIDGTHAKDEEDDKPILFPDAMKQLRAGYSASAYNVQSCNLCHINNGIALLPPVGSPVHHTIAKTMDSDGSSHPSFGNQLQTNGANKEGDLIIERFESSEEVLADGSVVVLRKPIFKVKSASDTSGLGLSIRRPPALIGIGLLNEISDATIMELESRSEGKAGRVDGKIARFGWKASQVDLKAQIKAALKNDMGVLTDAGDRYDCKDCTGGKVLDEEAVEQMQAYVSLLGTPPRNFPNNPQVKRGGEIFFKLDCQSCHVAELKTRDDASFPELRSQTVRAYTDLLLHDMGPGLADQSAGPDARLWRTAPLWGLKNVRSATEVQNVRGTTISMKDTWPVAANNPLQLMHDGRAGSIAEAILWHGGEAQESVDRYKNLSADERNALEAFLFDL